MSDGGDDDRYPIPAAEHRAEQSIQRSRFVATVAEAASVEEAAAFVRRVSEEFADATHNCWAYVVGRPGATDRVGMSDDGEPHGTAGRPMLNVLLHSGVGDVAAVVTRYYGGTKLGTGGLVRAYGGCLQRALLTLPRAERVEWTVVRARVGYGHVTTVRQTVAAHGGLVDAEDYAAEVTYALRLPSTTADAFMAALRDATRGTAVVERDEG